MPQSIASILAEHERETKLSLARSARRMAKDAEQATLRQAPYVHKAAQVASITHGWGEKGKESWIGVKIGAFADPTFPAMKEYRHPWALKTPDLAMQHVDKRSTSHCA